MAGNKGPGRIRVICGPTGAGKSYVAMWLANQFNGAIISADSRQVYRGFDIGTAKPSPAERAQAEHFGIDVLDPRERSNAAWWANAANGWIADAGAAGRVPVVVGGTGMYLRALFGNLFQEPELDADRRRSLQALLDSFSVFELRRWVEELDPDRGALGRTQLVRAIEVALLSGQRLSTLHREDCRPPLHAARYLVVDPGAVLADIISMRVRSMLDGGWPDEVAALQQRQPDDAPAWNASGYKVVRDMVNGLVSPKDAEERIVIETRQYAKRQRTWFRHQLDAANVTRIDPRSAHWQDDVCRWWGESS